jgi:hypothetical protein
VNRPKQYVTRRTVRARFGDISEMTLWRWERNPSLAFPKPLTINGRKYYNVSEIEGWEQRRGVSWTRLD